MLGWDLGDKQTFLEIKLMVSPNTSWITGEWETQNISHLQELNEFSSVGLKVYVIYLMNNLCTNSVQNRHMPVKSPINVLSKPFGCDGIQGHFFPTLSFLALNPLLPPPNCFCPTPPKDESSPSTAN